jgi:hypothetical protein
MNAREQRIREAREMISDARLTAFLKAIRSPREVLAAKLINDDLDKGERLDDIFYTGDEYGYLLSVTRESESRFEISFGCAAGSLAGDGGEWQVSFDGDAVQSVSGGGFWIS